MKSHFFISYNQVDRSWAEWVAWQLEQSGYKTVIQAWDFRPGSNFVLEMDKATKEVERIIVVLSQDYLDASFTHTEWTAALAQDPEGKRGTLLPVRVRECESKGLMAQVIFIDLVGLEEEPARKRLLDGVHRGRAKPPIPPYYPGALQHSSPEQPLFPGGLPPGQTLSPLVTPQASRSKSNIPADFADYDCQRQAIIALLEPDCKKRILIVRGDSGTGKTKQFQYCFEYCREGTLEGDIYYKCIVFAFKEWGKATSVADIMFRCGNVLGWENMRHFKERLARWLNHRQMQGQDNLQVERNQINTALTAKKLTDREERRADLTGAWFTDLRTVNHSVLFAFDDYEEATEDVRRWIESQFLVQVAHGNHRLLRVFIAGEQVPTPNIEWGHCCISQQLSGITDAQNWLPMFEQKDWRHRFPDVTDPLSFLVAVCQIYKGHPSSIMGLIGSLN